MYSRIQYVEDLLDKIKYGNKQEANTAIKKVGDFWHGIPREKVEIEKKKLKIFVDEMENFDKITNLENQIYFIHSLQIPVWVLGDRYFKSFCNFILKHIEHPSGKVRRAILSLASWFSMIGLECVDGEARFGKKLDKEEIELMKRNKELYFELVSRVEKLIDKHYDAMFDKYEYIDDLPASVYKSLEYLISKELLRVTKYEILYEEYLNKQKGYEVPKEILMERKEIEIELTKMLEEANSDFDLDDIKEIIFDEEGSGDMQKIIRIFDDGDIENLSNVLEVVSDAWNYFPHKILNGKCPEEMLELQ